MITFPADPEVGQEYVADNSATYQWSGVLYIQTPENSGGVIAECIYSSEGWIPLYGTNSPT